MLPIITLTHTCVSIARKASHFITGLSATVQRTQGLDVDISVVTARVNILRLTTERL